MVGSNLAETNSEALPPEEEATVEVRFAAGETIFSEGDDSEFAFVILEGTVELTKNSEQGPISLRKLSVGETLGEMGVIDGSARSVTATASTDVRMKRMDIYAFLARLEDDTPFTLEILHRLVADLRETTDRLTHQRFIASDVEAPRARRRAGFRPGLFGRLREYFNPDRDLDEFQPDAVEIERRRLPALAKYSVAAISCFFVLAVLWASWAEIDTAVSGFGRVTTSVPNFVVQPLETALVRNLGVTEGEVVEKGQVLATLDATFAQADLSTTRSMLTSVLAQEARLKAELTGVPPTEVLPQGVALGALQTEIYQRRQAERAATLRAYDEQVNQLRAEIATSRGDAADMAAQVEVLVEIEGMRERLMGAGHGSRLNFLTAKHQRLSVEREQRRLLSATARMQHELRAVEAERTRYLSDWSSRTAQELVQVRRERERLGEQLKKAERRESLVQLVAPARGIVLEIAERSIGSVVQQAEPMFTIVPMDVGLQVEVDIQPKDVSQVRVGDPVRIKLDALPFQKHGVIEGRIAVISEDTIKSKGGKGAPPEGDVYRAEVELTDAAMENVPDNFRLIPGMSGTAEIIVGKRRLISYFLYPVLRTVNASFREP